METYLKVYESSENSNEKEQILFTADEKSKRIIEKTIFKTFYTTDNSRKSILNERNVYVYNDRGKISQIFSVSKSNSSNFEFLDLETREVKQNYLPDTNLTSEVIISRIQNVGKNRKKQTLRHIYLENDQDRRSREIYVKPKYIILNNEKAFFYKYARGNSNELNLIKEYEILLDLRIINKFLNIFNVPVLTWLLISIPPIMIKKLINEKKVISNNGYENVHRSNQDYIASSFVGSDYCNLSEILLTEDYFISENLTLMKTYAELSKLEKI
jgi:hypothetical protein